MNTLIITFLIIVSEFWLYVSDNVSLDESDTYQEYYRWIGLPDKADAASFLNRNTSHTTQENETNLGRSIAECYLDPLCFKLEIP
ncbi:MAG: hypothetical protein ACRD4J_05930 [Nitrososphaeraceae archaeon]